MSVASLIDPIRSEGGATTLPDIAEWGQGRTLYGGASALIAYTSAIRAFTDLPPLRAAQVGFVSPVGTQVELRREILRQGRNVTQVRSEIWSDSGCALTSLWLFGDAREANAVHPAAAPDDWPGPPVEAEEIATDSAPQFIRNHFDIRRAQEQRGPGEPTVRRWVRLRDADGVDAVSRLILMGDVLPPGAMRAMKRQGPISSINWSFNLLDNAPASADGWWLAENASQHADAGYSSERLRMWSSDGRQLLDGMQSVAVFG
ncbi:acyl-CoA thioesterase [Qipengyuania spongiae]|uniref:Thioesterase family protein n=1 Tax=Qipengyuania spongiae TaxID=2909673 RepID=A0ABY5T6I6_9SPHN|nr:thioesterase family protein [Qipengyuania spongiae]UVI40564.1 thioesterase family protein [Qipengyuania spongiae]